jgi:cytochrome c556
MWQVSAVAQSGASDRQLAAIEGRQAAMKRVGAAMKTLVGFSKGDIADSRQALEAAKTMESSGKQFRKLLVQGTAVGVGKSKSKPEIWTDPRDFNQQMKAFLAATEAAQRAAAKGDRAALGAQLGPLGDSCKACHTKYQHRS